MAIGASEQCCLVQIYTVIIGVVVGLTRLLPFPKDRGGSTLTASAVCSGHEWWPTCAGGPTSRDALVTLVLVGVRLFAVCLWRVGSPKTRLGRQESCCITSTLLPSLQKAQWVRAPQGWHSSKHGNHMK